MASATYICGSFGIDSHSVADFLPVDYLPVYFQACRDSSPIRSSVEMFGYLFVLGPCVIMGGVSVAVLKRYRPQLWTGWAFAVTGAGLYTMVSTDTALSVAIGLQVITGAGIGGLFCSSIGFTYVSGKIDYSLHQPKPIFPFCLRSQYPRIHEPLRSLRFCVRLQWYAFDPCFMHSISDDIVGMGHSSWFSRSSEPARSSFAA